MNTNKVARPCNNSFFSVYSSKFCVFFENNKNMLPDAINFQKMLAMYCS